MKRGREGGGGRGGGDNSHHMYRQAYRSTPEVKGDLDISNSGDPDFVCFPSMIAIPSRKKKKVTIFSVIEDIVFFLRRPDRRAQYYSLDRLRKHSIPPPPSLLGINFFNAQVQI